MLAADLDAKLLKSALEPITKLENLHLHNTLSNNECNYCSRFITKSYLILLDKNVEVNNNNILQWLYEMNQNSLSFFDYKTDIFNIELDNCENNIHKMDTLLQFVKETNQNTVPYAETFKEKLPCIKLQINNWLLEEIEYLRKTMKLQASQPPISNTENKNKLLSGLSVAQLSYFSSLLLQSGIIKHANQSDIFRLLSENFKTVNTDQISVDSIKSKYYNIESSTKSAVREKIIDLLNLTKL